MTRALVGRTVADVERDLILETLKHCLGNRTHAANILGISIRTLRNKLNEYAADGVPIPPPGGGEIEARRSGKPGCDAAHRRRGVSRAAYFPNIHSIVLIVKLSAMRDQEREVDQLALARRLGPAARLRPPRHEAAQIRPHHRDDQDRGAEGNEIAHRGVDPCGATRASLPHSQQRSRRRDEPAMTETKFNTALIVGAGSGLSASLARVLTKEGIKVALAARSTDDLHDLARRPAPRPSPATPAKRADVEKLFADLDATFGAPEIVIYNASYRTRGPFAELDPAEVEKSIAVTAFGAFLVAQQAVQAHAAERARRRSCSPARRRA